MNPSLAYILFMKMYKKQLQTYCALYIEHETPLSEEAKRRLHSLCMSFINFISRQPPHKPLQAHTIEYWIQIHHQSIDSGQEHFFPDTLEYALTKVFESSEQHHPQEIMRINHEIIAKSLHALKNWQLLSFAQEDVSKLNEQLDLFSLDLIEHNGTEDLPYLLVRIEEIFQFKRCIFFSYNPWLEEFSGVIGSEMEKVQRMRGKIALEPVFSMKKPIFLKSPAPYVQQVAIELFDLSSVIFIPVIYRHELYGWISLDQMGTPFDCSAQQLKLYEQIGNRLAMYLARKQIASKMNYAVALTEKEQIILHLLAEGFSNKQLAQNLFISEYTVRDYVQNLLSKLQVNNRTQLITMAFRIGLID